MAIPLSSTSHEGGPLATCDNATAWVIVSDRMGDARQALAIAQAIGLPYEVKRAVPFGGSVSNKKAPRGSPLAHLDPTQSSVFDPPWPAMFLTVGSWPTSVALALKREVARDVPIVLLGRPRPGELKHFRAIIVTSQYSVPDHPSVIRMMFPPHPRDPDGFNTPPAVKFTCKRRPITAVFIGGETTPFRFGPAEARRICEQLSELQRGDSGDLIVATSARTSDVVFQTLRRQLPRGSELFDWHSDPPAANPYQDLLAHADRFVVTGDSASMLIDVAARSRPLAIAELPIRYDLSGISALVRTRLADLSQHRRLTAQVLMQLHKYGLMGFGRDLGALHRAFYTRGLATRFGVEPFKGPCADLPNELPGVAAKIRERLGITPDRAVSRSF